MGEGIMRCVYIAYPIDQFSEGSSDLTDLYNAVEYGKQMLLDNGVDMVYDPGDAWTVGLSAEVGTEIQHVNGVALNRSTGMLAFLPAGVTTIGVPQEISEAERYGIPVAVISNAKSWNLGRIEQFPETMEGIVNACRWLVAQPDLGSMQSQGNRMLVAGNGRTPTKAYPDDAGYDLYVSEPTMVPAGQFVDVPCGVRLRLPRHSFGMVVGRSSTFRKIGLVVHTGIIDTGYTGPMFAGVFNAGTVDRKIEVDERIAQIVLIPNMARATGVLEVDDLGMTTRGQKGFGSSGR